MGRFDRYVLSQLMMLFGFFSLVLVLIYWINRAVVLFDQLIADGQSAFVFLEFTALTLPTVIRLALPLAAFAASIYVTNKLTTESELVVVQATGFSAFRLARPALYFGIIVFLLMSILMHILVPNSTARLDQRERDIAQNFTARLLTPGQFVEPIANVTFYVREVTPAGELLDIFLSDTRNSNEQVTYTAAQAYLVRDAGETQLVMIDGLAQTLRKDDQRLFTTSFDDFVYNIGTLISNNSRIGRRARHVPTLELLNASEALQQETRDTRAELLARAHDRIAQSLLGVVGALLGFAALMVGGFSRFGVWRQIVGAIALIIVVKGIESGSLNMARDDARLWFMVYLPSIAGFVMIWGLLFAASRPYLFKRRPQTAESA